MATVQYWSNSEVIGLLEKLELKALVPVFEKNAVNGSDLLSLSDEEFKSELGCTNLQVKKLRGAISGGTGVGATALQKNDIGVEAQLKEAEAKLAKTEEELGKWQHLASKYEASVFAAEDEVSAHQDHFLNKTNVVWGKLTNADPGVAARRVDDTAYRTQKLSAQGLLDEARTKSNFYAQQYVMEKKEVNRLKAEVAKLNAEKPTSKAVFNMQADSVTHKLKRWNTVERIQVAETVANVSRSIMDDPVKQQVFMRIEELEDQEVETHFAEEKQHLRDISKEISNGQAEMAKLQQKLHEAEAKVVAANKWSEKPGELLSKLASGSAAVRDEHTALEVHVSKIKVEIKAAERKAVERKDQWAKQKHVVEEWQEKVEELHRLQNELFAK